MIDRLKRGPYLFIMKRISIYLAFVILIFHVSCEENLNNTENLAFDEDTTKVNSIAFHLDHTVDGKGVVYDDIRYENEAGNKYSVMTLRYYISDIKLHQYDGTIHEIDTFYYRDIDLPETRTLIVDDIPNGQYAYISFTFGLDSVKNESYALPSTYENNNMEWPIPMGGGYHYMKFEGRYIKDDGSIGSFNTHTGRLKTKDGKINENFFQVELPFSAFEVNNNSWDIQILMNLNEWYRTPHTYDIEEFGPAIMGNQNAQQYLMENGADAFTMGRMFIK